MYNGKQSFLIISNVHGFCSIGVIKKVDFFEFLPLRYFVLYFVILCGTMIYVLPQRYTKAFTKGLKGHNQHVPSKSIIS
jgi:hypothetical protein